MRVIVLGPLNHCVSTSSLTIIPSDDVPLRQAHPWAADAGLLRVVEEKWVKEVSLAGGGFQSALRGRSLSWEKGSKRAVRDSEENQQHSKTEGIREVHLNGDPTGKSIA